MKINITLDTSSVSRFVSKIGKGRLVASFAVVLLAGASTYAYAITNTPTHVFSAGDPISASDVNENFSELFTAANTAESEIDTLQTDVGTLQTDVGTLQTDVSSIEGSVSTLQTDVSALEAVTPVINSCLWRYSFISGTSGTRACLTSEFALTGSCIALGGQVTGSRPDGLGGANPAAATAATGWRCSGTASGMDARALCCPR